MGAGEAPAGSPRRREAAVRDQIRKGAHTRLENKGTGRPPHFLAPDKDPRQGSHPTQLRPLSVVLEMF